MKKRIISFVLAVLFILNICTVGIFATSSSEMSILRWTNTSTLTCNVVFSGKTGYVTASIRGVTGVNQITATVKLYSKNSSGGWTEIPTNWTYDKNSDILSINESFTGTSGVEYKVTISGKVYKDGVGESVSDSATGTCP